MNDERVQIAWVDVGNRRRVVIHEGTGARFWFDGPANEVRKSAADRWGRKPDEIDLVSGSVRPMVRADYEGRVRFSAQIVTYDADTFGRLSRGVELLEYDDGIDDIWVNPHVPTPARSQVRQASPLQWGVLASELEWAGD